MGCKNHEVMRDPDPDDWFCDDDCAVVCKLTKNKRRKIGSRYLSERSEFKIVTCACRPYNLKKETEIPNWCPKGKKK